MSHRLSPRKSPESMRSTVQRADAPLSQYSDFSHRNARKEKQSHYSDHCDGARGLELFFIVGLTCYLRWDARTPAPRVKRCLLILRCFFTIRGSHFAIPRAFPSPRATTARLPTAFNPSHLALFSISSLKRPRSNLSMHNLLTFSFEGKLLLPALYEAS